jgi:hypothetical protein
LAPLTQQQPEPQQSRGGRAAQTTRWGGSSRPGGAAAPSTAAPLGPSPRGTESEASTSTAAPDLFDDLWHGPNSAWDISALRHGLLLPAELAGQARPPVSGHGRTSSDYHTNATALVDNGSAVPSASRIPSSSNLSDPGGGAPPWPATPPAAGPSGVAHPGMVSMGGGAALSHSRGALWQPPLLVRSGPRVGPDSRRLEVWLPDSHGTTAMMRAPPPGPSSSCPDFKVQSAIFFLLGMPFCFPDDTRFRALAARDALAIGRAQEPKA